MNWVDAVSLAVSEGRTNSQFATYIGDLDAVRQEIQ